MSSRSRPRWTRPARRIRDTTPPGVLEGEGPNPEEDDGEAGELVLKFSRRQLRTNADRYLEAGARAGIGWLTGGSALRVWRSVDGASQASPKWSLRLICLVHRVAADLGRIGPFIPAHTTETADDDDVDHSLAHISSNGIKPVTSRKGKVEQIEWDEGLDELEREKASAVAIWDLKSRFRAKSEKLRKSSVPAGRPHPSSSSSVVEAPPLPLPDGSQPPPDGPKEDMQDFLDDLLT